MPEFLSNNNNSNYISILTLECNFKDSATQNYLHPKCYEIRRNTTISLNKKMPFDQLQDSQLGKLITYIMQ